MLPLLAIPIVNEVTQATSASAPSFFARPIDAVFFDIFLYFGWIPIFITVLWGFIQMWKNWRQGMYVGTLKYVLLAIDVPAMTEQSPKALENLFANIYGCKSSITWKEEWILGKLHPVFSFEIISTEGYIQFLVRTQTRFRDIIEAGIYAHYPDAEISEVEDYTKHFPKEFPNDEYEMWGGELTLEKHYMYPIRTYVDFEDRVTQEIKDPLGNTLEQMAKMRPGEHFWIQFVIQPSTNDWIKEGIKRVNQIYGIEEKKKRGAIERGLITALDIPSGVIKEMSNFDLLGTLFDAGVSGEEDPWKAFKLSIAEVEEAKAILQKSQKVGHGVKTRILYVAKKNAFVKVERTGMVKGILNQFTAMNYNKFTLFIPQVPKDDYFWMRWVYTKRQRNLMAGYVGRSYGIGADPSFLNAEELATLWHFPTISIKAPLVKKSESRRAEPPVGLPITGLDNTLPNFDSDENGPAGLPGFGVEPPPLPGMTLTHGSSSTGATSEPPMGLPGTEPLPETLPRVVPPTQHAPIESDSITDVQSPSTVPEDDLMPPEDLLPQITNNASETESPSVTSSQNDFVPPNLPT